MNPAGYKSAVTQGGGKSGQPQGVAQVALSSTGVLLISGGLDEILISATSDRISLTGIFFDPSSLTHTARFDSTDVNDFTLNGVDISQWDDLSGNGNHLVQASASLQPFYNTVTNAVDFDGVDEYLRTSLFSSAISQPYTIFVVAQADDIASNQSIFDGVTGASSLFIFSNNTIQLFFTGTLTTDSDHTAVEKIHTLLLDTADKYYINGVDDSTVDTTAGTADMDGITLGASRTAGSHLQGTVKYMGVLPSALTTTQLNNYGEYLADRFGLSWTTIS